MSEILDEVRTKRLVVEDAQGRECAVIGTNEKGFTSIALFDKQGVARVAVELSESGMGAITMSNPEGLAVLTLMGNPGGVLGYRDGAGRWRVL